MKFALYKAAPSLISSLIRWQTGSVYSHVAIAFGDVVYEAVGEGFVRSDSIGQRHAPGTLVDLLEYKVPILPREEERARACCERMVGAPYDYEMVLSGFTLRYCWEPKRARRKYFCSEAAYLVGAAMDGDRLLLERCSPWEVSPEDINRSPRLMWLKTVKL